MSWVENILPSNEPIPNFGVERYRLRDYADCTTHLGCYWADLAAQILRATELMEKDAKAQPRGAKLAIVLDIDETSLTNYCEEVREDFGYIPDRYDAWTVSPEASMPIADTVALVKKAQSLGVDVFFITGRPESQRAATEANLKAAGYADWKGPRPQAVWCQLHLHVGVQVRRTAKNRGQRLHPSTEHGRSVERSAVAAHGTAQRQAA